MTVGLRDGVSHFIATQEARVLLRAPLGRPRDRPKPAHRPHRLWNELASWFNTSSTLMPGHPGTRAIGELPRALRAVPGNGLSRRQPVLAGQSSYHHLLSLLGGAETGMHLGVLARGDTDNHDQTSPLAHRPAHPPRPHTHHSCTRE